MQRAFEPPPTQLSVNQAAGIAVNAGAAAAVQPANTSQARFATHSVARANTKTSIQRAATAATQADRQASRVVCGKHNMPCSYCKLVANTMQHSISCIQAATHQTACIAAGATIYNWY
jgi:hypothetical protein